MIKLSEKHWFRKDCLDYDHAHISWSIRDKKLKEKGGLYFNWYLQRFDIGFEFSIGKSGINLEISLWFSIHFFYCFI